MTVTLLPEGVRSLETAEIAAFTDLYRAASPDVTAATGLGVRHIGRATLLTASRLDVLALNRLLGVGMHGPEGDPALDDYLAALGASGAARAFVAVAPFEGHEQLAIGLEQRGLRPYNNWIRLRRELVRLDDLPPATRGLDVHEIGQADASPFGRIVAAAFGYPPSLASVVEQSIGRPGWRHYLVMAGSDAIAAAALFVSGDAAWFGMAATEPAHRGRGAQHALIVQRLRDAAAMGCRRVSVETAEASLTNDAPSFRNLRRLGFEVAYRRPNYLWAAAPGSRV